LRHSAIVAADLRMQRFGLLELLQLFDNWGSLTLTPFIILFFHPEVDHFNLLITERCQVSE